MDGAVVMNLSAVPEDPNKSVFESLAPVLIQTFGLILLGLVAGKLGILTNKQAAGLGIYLTSFALPAIFFMVMVSIDFSDIDWYLVLAVSLGKAAIFFFTMTIVLVISRGRSIGLAGLLAIFTSQSNDVALAYPILRLLYPDLATYIYLFAPAQLVILNPFGYFALEWHKTREITAINSLVTSHSSTPSPPMFALICQRILKVIRHVASNPLFFMTIIGVIFNFILKHKLPDMIEGFFRDLGASFSATALFYLGFSMVGRCTKIDRRGIYILASILIGKVILSPFITREIAVLLLSHQPRNSSISKSNFAFLYAAAPTAPPVFLFAAKFGILPEIVGAGLVIGTFLYAPIMFLFSGMTTLVDPQRYDSTIEKAAVYLSWASLICCSWTLTVLIVTKKIYHVPYRFLVCLIVFVMLFCISLALGSIWNTKTDFTWGHYINFNIFFAACTASRVWTAFLCIAIFLQTRYLRPLSNRVQLLFYILGVVIPVLVTVVLIFTARDVTPRDINPAFHYGKAQQICSLIILTVCLSTSLITFLCIFRTTTIFSYRRFRLSTMRNRFWNNSRDEGSSFTSIVEDTEDVDGFHAVIESSPLLSLPRENLSECSISNELPPIVSSSVNEDSILQRSSTSDNREVVANSTPSFRYNDIGLHRFLILIIFLMISMFFGVCICLWRLVRDTEGGVFIVVEFFDQTFNFGQGVLIFVVFGIDSELIITPLADCISKWRHWLMCTFFPRPLPLTTQMPEEDVDHFVAAHLSPCMNQICCSLRLPSTTLESVFYFDDFHQWILQKLTSERGQQSRETTLSLLMALKSRNLIRRLGVGCVAAGLPAENNPSIFASLDHFNDGESPILFQYLRPIERSI